MNSMTISPLTPFSTISNLSISGNRSNFALFFFKAPYHANYGAGKEYLPEYGLYILRHIPKTTKHIS